MKTYKSIRLGLCIKSTIFISRDKRYILFMRLVYSFRIYLCDFGCDDGRDKLIMPFWYHYAFVVDVNIFLWTIYDISFSCININMSLCTFDVFVSLSHFLISAQIKKVFLYCVNTCLLISTREEFNQLTC